MIPKVVHYCWLSDDPFPASIHKYIDSWKLILTDYEFILWDLNRFDINSSLWVKQAFESKKYAFAADYIRLYAVYNYGGIYLDCDVEVLKKFDDLLSLPYFIGTEGRNHIEAGVFGAEKGTDWLRKCLEYYINRNFLLNDGRFDLTTLPVILFQQISKIKEIKQADTLTEVVSNNKVNSNYFYLLPFDYLCSKDHTTGQILTSENSYCIHHFAMSWLPETTSLKFSRLKKKLMNRFGVDIVNMVIHIFKLRELKNIFLK
jgi:mannosyltransferase OCH1-like enzyme